MRLATFLVSLLMATSVVAVSAQQWAIETVHRGDKRAVLVRGDQVLVVGADAPPPDRLRAMNLPSAGGELLRPAPRTRIVVSRKRTQLGRVSVASAPDGPRSRYEPLTQGWTIQTTGQPAFYVSDNGSTIVVAHLDIHNRGETEVAIHGRDGKELGRVNRPEIRRVHVAVDGSVVVLAGELRVYAFAVSDATVRPIGDIPPSPATELSPRGDWIARATDTGVAVHRLTGGIFSGEPTATLSSGVPTVLRFDDRSTHLAVADNQRVQLFELEGRTVRWQVPTDPTTTVTSLELATDASLVGVATVTVAQRETRTTVGQQAAEIQLRRRDGSMETRQSLPNGGWNTYAPSLTFFAQDRKLLIETSSDVFTLALGALK